MMTISKCYSELIKLKSFKDRFNYLSLDGRVGGITFGGHRYLNQKFYQSEKWKSVRREVILRDNGCDLSHEDYPIDGIVYIHHINPIEIEDIIKGHYCVLDLENLICVSRGTHDAIHYGNRNIQSKEFIVRKKNDTCLWR